ncbi:C6 zinc finger domain-containing protein [Colletotrichum incanum]|nr:C6 zinc finger domain-containing protein [Colletotrichum incanum]
MVGVAGRSRGCRACRRRKKGCDLRKPECNNCKRAHESCEYDRPHVFINTTGTGPGSSTIGKATPKRRSLPTTDVTLPHSLTRTAYEEKYFSLFWDLWFPCGSTSPGLSIKYPVADWMTAARAMYRDDSALRGTLLAMCLSTIGRHNRQDWLLSEGVKLYVQALNELNNGLRHPRRWSSDALLVASRGLGLFEAIAACMSRKRIFLSDTPWKTIPWLKSPKNAKDVLTDILVDVPALLEEIDLLTKAPQPATEIFNRFIETYRRLDRELSWWLANLSPGSQWLIDLQNRDFKSPTADEVALAQVMTLFWTACILVYSSLYIALPLCPASFASGIVEAPQHTNPKQYCTLVANTIEVFFEPEAGLVGMYAAPFLIGIATKYLMFTEGFDSRDCMKLIGYFQRQGGGAAIGRFLTNSLREWDKIDPHDVKPGQLTSAVNNIEPMSSKFQ